MPSLFREPFRAMPAWTLVAAGIALLCTATAHAQEWPTAGKYETQDMGRRYENYDRKENNNTYYMPDADRGQYKIEFRTDPDGVRRAYFPNGNRLDTSGRTGQAIYVMDARGDFYVIREGWIPWPPEMERIPRLAHSTLPGGRPIASAGHITAEDGVLKRVDNHSGHYHPENAHLIQAIQSLSDHGVTMGSYEVGFAHYDAVEARYFALDPRGEEKVRMGLLDRSPDAAAVSDAARPDADSARLAREEVRRRYPDVPDQFYRVGMLGWGELKLDAHYVGKKRFNLFLDLLKAQEFLYSGVWKSDRVIYSVDAADLAKTPEGLKFLQDLQEKRAEERSRGLGMDDRGAEWALVFADEEAFRATVLDHAKVYERLPSQPAPERSAPVAHQPAAPPPTEPASRAIAPAHVAPDLEARIVTLLGSPELAVDKLAQQRDAGQWDVFKNELFKPASDSPEATAEIVRAWKKVCAKQTFLEHGKLLAEMRWKMIVDIWAEMARDHGVPFELIDSGKRNAYSSDIDLTVYSPPELRGGLRLEGLIAEAARRFESTYGYPHAALDIVLHDGDVFLPDIRNHAQTVAEHKSNLFEVVDELRMKVLAGGDASYVPGANLEDVQKRGMRDGMVTRLVPRAEVVGTAEDGSPLETRFTKPTPLEVRISELSPSDGKLTANAARFRDLLPAYDRSKAFGALTQNLEKVFRNGDKHADVAKLFNRGMSQGPGAIAVNGYLDLHVSDLPPGAGLSPQAAAEIAFALEDPNTAPEARDRLRAQGRNKAVAKLRWIMRSFGYRNPAAAQTVTWLYEVLNTSAEMEVDKNNKKFDWQTGRERYMKRYFQEAKLDHPELAGTPHGIDKLYDEAWRRFCGDLTEVFEIGVVKLAADALVDLTPEGIRRNARLLGYQAGQAGAAEEAAQKLAETRRLELALLFDILNRYEIKKDPLFDVMTPDEEYHLEQRNPRIEALRDAIMKSAPPDLRADLQKLDRIARTKLDDFLAEGAGVRTPAELLQIKETRVAELTKATPEDAGLTNVTPEDAGRSVTDAELKQHLLRSLSMKANPADAPLLQQVLDALDANLRRSTTSEGTAANPKPLPLGAFFEQSLQSFTPLMMTSSVVSVSRAYQLGGANALPEALVGEAFNFLPPTYGVIGVALKDFSRGRVNEGMHSLAWLGGIHFADQLVPGAGHALLVYNIATGVPAITHTYVTEKINEDLLEQALRSQPEPGKRAKRNPYKDSPDLFQGDTPEFPLFWGDPCMDQPGDHLPFTEAYVQARRLYQGPIAAELDERVLQPALPSRPVWQGPGAVPRGPTQAEAEAQIKGSSKWAEEYYGLALKYAFDHLYYQRIARIYDCYFPQVKARRDQGFDEDNVLKHVFGKVVDDWFAVQPDGYKLEFDALLDIGPRAGTTRKRLLGGLTNHLIQRYKQAEQQAFGARPKLDAMKTALDEQQLRWVLAEKQLIAAKTATLVRLEKKVKQKAVQALSETSPPTTSRVTIQAPTWYVTVDPRSYYRNPLYGGGFGEMVNSCSAAGAASGGCRERGGEIPIDVVVQADGSAHSGAPEAWTHDFALTLDSTVDRPISRGAPPGFVPNENERVRLATSGPDGKSRAEVFTVRLVATANAYDAQGKLIGRAKPAPIVGYLIEYVPPAKPTDHVPELVTTLRRPPTDQVPDLVARTIVAPARPPTDQVPDIVSAPRHPPNDQVPDVVARAPEPLEPSPEVARPAAEPSSGAGCDIPGAYRWAKHILEQGGFVASNVVYSVTLDGSQISATASYLDSYQQQTFAQMTGTLGARMEFEPSVGDDLIPVMLTRVLQVPDQPRAGGQSTLDAAVICGESGRATRIQWTEGQGSFAQLYALVRE